MSLAEQPDSSIAKADAGQIRISTLGQFQVRRGDSILSKNTARSYRLWELFKYLITNRDKEIYSEVIMDSLWPEQAYADPRHTLRTMIYRLRQILDIKPGKAEASCIKFSHGSYCWNTEQEYWLDIEVFERLAHEGHQLTASDPVAAIDKYQDAVRLFKGDYLSELAYSEWVIPIRNYYHRLYLQTVLELITLLEKARRYAEVIKVCEKAFLIEFFEEELHISFLQALLKEGKTRQAMNHYEYATTVLYRELGVKPSPAMRELRRLMQVEDPSAAFDLTAIQDSLLDRKTSAGAFLCDPEVFRMMYRLESRRVERTGQAVFLAMLTIVPVDTRNPHPVLKELITQMQEQIVSRLRRGDVVTRWNDTQILIILPALNYEQAEVVLDRILLPIKADKHRSAYNFYRDIKPVLGDNLPSTDM